MIKSTTVNINIDKINIPSNFQKKFPANKVIERIHTYIQTGVFDREIIIDEHNNLLDGYTTYLVCKMVGLAKVRALRIRVKFTAQELCEMLREQIDRDFARKVGAEDG